MRRNLEVLLRHSKRQPDFDFMHAVRVIAEFIVIMVHTRAATAMHPQRSPISVECEAHQPHYQVSIGVVTLIQNFFLLSGFLSFYLNLKRIYINGETLKTKDFLELIIKRLVRLWPLYTFMVFFNATIMSKRGTGPLWIGYLEGERMCCRKNWWINLLFLNNFFKINEPVKFIVL